MRFDRLIFLCIIHELAPQKMLRDQIDVIYYNRSLWAPLICLIFQPFILVISCDIRGSKASEP